MREPYWFAAKRYGWGWGLPLNWRGCAVLLGYAALAIAGLWIFPPQTSLPAFIGYQAALSILLVGVCFWKGEPPRWRWGD